VADFPPFSVNEIQETTVTEKPDVTKQREEVRRQRAAEALRANLKRRKEQQHRREQTESDTKDDDAQAG